jgi:peptide/nickel transport system substrate-binding protein
MARRDLLGRILRTGFVAVALSACGVLPLGPADTTLRATASPRARSGGTLRIGLPGDIVSTAVPLVVTASNFEFNSMVYDTLVRYDADLNPQPALATSWTWSSDFRRLTLAMRSGVQFHSGRLFTSQDARSNLERLRSPLVGSQWRGYAESMHVETPDDGTLVINYDAPLRSSFDVLALAFMADPLTIDQSAEGREFIGTGPFRFKEWAQGDHVALVRSSNYWQAGKPYVEAVELRVFADPATAVASLEADALDWLTGVPGQDAKRLSTAPAYKVLLSGSGGTFYYVGLDVTHPSLVDRRVRQAFGYALNRARMVDVALYGFGRPTCIAWPQRSIGYDAVQDQTYVYDLERARALLRDAAWDSTTTVPLIIPDFVSLAKPAAQVLQSDLQSVGVQVSIQPLSPAEFGSRGLKGQFGGAWISPTTFMNLSPATFLMTSSNVRIPNAANFVTPQYKQSIDQVVNATDDQALKSAVHQVTQIMLDEAFMLPFAEGAGQLNGPEVARTRVNDARWDAFGLFAYQDIWLSQ